MKITDGGATSNVRRETIEEIRVTLNEGSSPSLYLWINDSLSYMSIAEAVALRDEINAALKETLKLT